MKVGQQKRVPLPAFGTKQRHHLFAAYDWRTDQVSWMQAERKNSEHFIAFLDQLLNNCYPKGRIVLVLDNATYHRSAASQAALSLFEHRVLVIWLPSYCSDLNPIERFWRHLKDLACANRLWTGLLEMLAAVENILMEQNTLTSPLRFLPSKNICLPT